MGKAAASNFVVDEVGGHPLPRFGNQVSLDATADLVVFDDEELEEHVVLRLVDSVEDARKRGVAVDQQLDTIPSKERHVGQGLCSMHGFSPPFVLDPVSCNRLDRVTGNVSVAVVGAAPSGDVPLEPATTEHPVRGHREIGKDDQRNRPGDGAL